MADTTLTLLTRPGCHLCDDARDLVGRVAETARRGGVHVAVVERSIADEPQLAARYADDIPVVLIDDAFHARWRVDASALEAALRRAGA